MNGEIFQKAIEKLDREADAVKVNDGAIRAIEEMMRTVCGSSEAACLAVLDEGKTLEGAYGALYEEAKKRRGNTSCVCFGMEEASRIVLGYYGISEDEPIDEGKNPPEAAESQTSGDPGVVDLFDLL